MTDPTEWTLAVQTLAAVTGRKSTPFHGADGADALQLQAIGQGPSWTHSTASVYTVPTVRSFSSHDSSE